MCWFRCIRYTLWTLSGGQSATWLEATVPIESSYHRQIIFEVEAISDTSGKLALLLTVFDATFSHKSNY